MMLNNTNIRIAIISTTDKLAIRLMLTGISVAGHFTGVQDCLQAMETQNFDVVIIDTQHMPKGKEVDDCIRRLRERHPHTKVMVISTQARSDEVRAWINAGASGIITSDELMRGFLGAIDTVYRGQMTLSPKILSVLL
jgi:DNA-binding NarL/FixJ family response regulator